MPGGFVLTVTCSERKLGTYSHIRVSAAIDSWICESEPVLFFLPSIPAHTWCRGIAMSPYYPKVIERLKTGNEIFLDLGCCFGQE